VSIRFVIVVLLALPTLLGCETLQSVLETAPKPDASITDVRLSGLSLDGADLDFDVEVRNPYDVGLPLADIEYALAGTGNEAFLSGSLGNGKTIKARSSRTLTVPARVNFASLLGTVTGVRPGDVVPYTADLTIPNVPTVSVEKLAWEDLSFNTASGVIALRVENTNGFPISLDTLDYGLKLAGSNIASARVTDAASLDAGDATVIEIPLSFSPKQFGLGLFNLLRGADADYAFTGDLAVTTPFGPLQMPVNSEGKTPFQF
jgi:LEA14-like dessication related protein